MINILKVKKANKFIHKTSVALTIIMFILAHGTLGALEREHIEFMVALHRLIIFVVLIIFGSGVAYWTREGEKK